MGELDEVRALKYENSEAAERTIQLSEENVLSILDKLSIERVTDTKTWKCMDSCLKQLMNTDKIF